MPPQGMGPAGEISGDHILSPHIEAAHRVNVSIVLSSGAISMMVVGVVLYCLIKRKIVRCCVKDSPVHLLEQGGNSYNANMAFQHQLGPQLGSQPSAPTALQFQAPQAPCLADIENSLARMQLQYAAMANQLSSQKEQLEKQKTPGAPGSTHGAPRNQYPMV